ncbi:MAG: lipopolysaccharide N-acetylmannosaminouronosyltransferase, partial [Bacteroidetes bacterium CG_4_8_14_3_um_filter_31_14]
YTDNVKRTPVFFVKLGLEWFYRLAKQPARIGRQIILVKFFWKLIMGKI